jgi:tetratricopeptide (TPR) repeat protein
MPVHFIKTWQEKSVMITKTVIAGFAVVLATLSSLQAAEEEPVRVFRQVSPSVVELSSVSGHGTGILLNSSGLVLTNAHVVVSPVPFRGRLDVERNGKWETAEFPNVRVLAMHPQKDMALVQLDMSQQPGVKVSPAMISNSKASPGQSIYAIGNPGAGGMNLTKTITSGLLSGVDREIEKVSYYQISAPINPGNSGGPLTDRNGNVLGIVTLKFQNSENVGFAIPLHDLDLSEFGPPNRRPVNKARAAELMNVSSMLLKKFGEFEKRKQLELPQAKMLQFLLVQTYHEAMLNDPGDPKTYYMLGVVLLGTQSHEQAETFLLQALEMDPWAGGGAPYRWMGVTQVRLKQPVDAESVWLEGVAKHPMDAGQIWEDLAIHYRFKSEWQKGAVCAAKALFLHHVVKRPAIRPDFLVSLISLCKSKLSPVEVAALDGEIREIPAGLQKVKAEAEKQKQEGNVMLTPAFEKWLESRNRTLGRKRQSDQTALATLTNALLPPFVPPGTQLADSAVATTTNSSTTTSARPTTPRATNTSPAPTQTGSANGSAENLSGLIDVNRHAVRGEWKLKGESLVSPRTAKARIEIPASLPQEYDLEFSATRVSGSGELVVGFVREGVQSIVYIDRAGYTSGINGVTRPLFSKSLLRRSKSVRLKFAVRREGLTVYADGREAFNSTSSAEFPPTSTDWKVRNEFGAFLGSDSSMVMIRDITLKPTTGK